MTYYAILVESNCDGDFESIILNNKLFTNKDEAREVMNKDFNTDKSDFDEIDDIDEYHELDHCCLSANYEFSRSWYVIELSL